MQEFNTFDIIIISITVLLGLKGLLKGFIKEAFGLIGIIGGLFVASRFAEFVGNQAAPFLAIESESAKLLFGFIIALIGFWILIYILGLIVSKVTAMSGLGVIDRAIGFIFGGAKIFLIFSVVAYLAIQVNAFKNILNKKDMIKNSMTFPILVETGSFIFQLDTSKFLNQSDEVEKETTKEPSMNKETSEIQEDFNKEIQNLNKTAQETAVMVKEKASELMNEAIEEVIIEKITPSENK